MFCSYIFKFLIETTYFPGLSFLSGGFISLFQIRHLIRQHGTRDKVDKLEKLIVKIGIFR